MNIFLDKPSSFDFLCTVNSHGWTDLAPFSFDQSESSLSYVFSGSIYKKPISAKLTDLPDKICIETEKISAAQSQLLVKRVAYVLRFDDNFSDFYEITKRKKEFRWINRIFAGRLIRADTVFEDLIKTICTTNCSWNLTISMIRNLVEHLGQPVSDGSKSFPLPEALASKDERFFREVIRTGYRAPYFVELSRSISDGKLDPEQWLDSEISTPELKKQIKAIKGVGEYAAETLLKLLGRYEGLALDSWLRAEFYNKYCNGEKCDDAEIADFYEEFGKFRGLAIWLDMSKRWIIK
ncbi:MAG: DNA-3-methyladenine glycosylase family protein [Pyrinomonadaceae bacterium]